MTFALLEQYPTLQHLVSEKAVGAGCAFSLALHTGEPEETVLENREMLRRHFDEKSLFVGVQQVHGSRVFVVRESVERGWQGLEDTVEADALVTNLPGMVLTILTADCVPLLLYDPVAEAVGAAHAGWKGTQDGIAIRIVEKMRELYGSRAEDIRAVIAPAIGQCCYEVGVEVAEHFGDYPGCVEKGKVAGKYQMDLKGINRQQLLRIGLKEPHIAMSPVCTACRTDRFFSYRAEQGCSGRFVSAIGLRKG